MVTGTELDADDALLIHQKTQYRPYGSDSFHFGSETDYKFTDQEQDTSTGLYNYDARLYDPMIGQFNIPDTLLPDVYDPQQLNRYAYCRNNPLKYTDPSGHTFGEMIDVCKDMRDKKTKQNHDYKEWMKAEDPTATMLENEKTRRKDVTEIGPAAFDSGDVPGVGGVPTPSDPQTVKGWVDEIIDSIKSIIGNFKNKTEDKPDQVNQSTEDPSISKTAEEKSKTGEENEKNDDSQDSEKDDDDNQTN